MEIVMDIANPVLNNVMISKDSLQPGDHIFAWKKYHTYSHHGIYEGEGKVINFVDFPEPLGSVKRCTLEEFLEGCQLCRLDYPNQLGNLEPPEEVLHRAKFLLETNGFGTYKLIGNNCEDFAIYCKTGCILFENGKPMSRCTQIKAALNVFTTMLGPIPGFLFDFVHLLNPKELRRVPVEQYAQHHYT